MLELHQNRILSKFIFKFIYPERMNQRSLSGRVTMGAFLQFLNERNAILTNDLHEGKKRRPYVVSNIRFLRGHDEAKNIGVFSITTIEPQIIETIVNSLYEQNLNIYINNNYCKIISIDYVRKDLSVSKLISNGTTFRFRFLTPVVFASDHRKSKTEAYPRLELIWNNLLKTYEFLIEKLDEMEKSLFIRNAINQLSTPHFNLRSVHQEMGKKIRITAFTGTILFMVENNENMELLPILLDIADFWGIGGKRSMGFGNVSLKITPPNNVEAKKIKNK